MSAGARPQPAMAYSKAEEGEFPVAMDTSEDTVLNLRNLNYTYTDSLTSSQGTGPPNIADITCDFAKGSRVLVAGANGSGKSTLLSIMGGKKMIPRGQCLIHGKEAFHDSSLGAEVMYCGDWWRTDFFFNISIKELIGDKIDSPRVQRLMEILQIDLSWRINSVSDGQRRRCQLLEALSVEKSVYIMDEITTDLDLFAREGLLNFLRHETEERGATIFYATHIFDRLAEWATHIIYFQKGRITRCCAMKDLHEYHELVNAGDRVPLYNLMKQWVFKNYTQPLVPSGEKLGEVAVQCPEGPVINVKGLTYAYAAGLPPVLRDIVLTVERGSRVLAVGANGASKTTLLSILGGKRMIPRGFAYILTKDPFNDTQLGKDVMYMGDWWRTKFYMNLKFKELLNPELIATPRCQYLADVLQVDFEWKINEISDGQRRRCQLLENLSLPKAVYFMDEITSDLDLYAREGVLSFLVAESEIRGATIVYCTHIFDHLENWATHLLLMSKGQVLRNCPMSEVEEYNKLIADGVSCPLYNLMRNWIYAEYEEDIKNQAHRPKVEESWDGRVPNLGLAGPFMTCSG